MHYLITWHHRRSGGTLIEANDVRTLCSSSQEGWRLNAFSSETKLKDLPPVAPVPPVAFSLDVGWLSPPMRWKCDTVRWDSRLGLHEDEWRCVCDTFPASPSCSQNSCWGLLWQLSTESTRIHLPSTALLFQLSHSHFFFFHSFCNIVIQAVRSWVVERLKMWWNALLFWRRLGRRNYPRLWNRHTVEGNRAAKFSRYLQTRIRKRKKNLWSCIVLSSFHVTFDSFIKSEAEALWLWTNLSSAVRQEKQNKSHVFSFW